MKSKTNILKKKKKEAAAFGRQGRRVYILLQCKAAAWILLMV